MATAAHQATAYLVALVLLAAAVVGVVQAREARPFVASIYVVTVVLLDVHVLGGLVLYVASRSWNHASGMIRYAHPLAALLAVVAAHRGLRRSRRAATHRAAHRIVAGGLVVALFAVLVAIALASGAT